MKPKFILFLFFLFFNFASSQENVNKSNDNSVSTSPAWEDTENGKIENGVYTCYRFDWKIKIPLNYPVTDVKQIEELERKSYEAAQKASPNGTAVKPNRPHLIGFGIDNRNNFSATFESLAGSKITSLEEHKNSVLKVLHDTFSPIETLKFESSSDNVSIGKYNFYKIRTKLYDAKTNELLLTQDLYNTFIDNNLFSVNINFANPVIGKMLTDNFVESLTK